MWILELNLEFGIKHFRREKWYWMIARHTELLAASGPLVPWNSIFCTSISIMTFLVWAINWAHQGLGKGKEGKESTGHSGSLTEQAANTPPSATTTAALGQTLFLAQKGQELEEGAGAGWLWGCCCCWSCFTKGTANKPPWYLHHVCL